MRFQHISNKKLVLISLLSFSSGLVLLNNADIAKADTVNNGSDSEVVASENQNSSASADTQANTSAQAKNDNSNTPANNNTGSNIRDSSNSNTNQIVSAASNTGNNQKPVSYAVASAPSQSTNTANNSNNSTTNTTDTGTSPSDVDSTSVNYTVNYYDSSTKNLIGSVASSGKQGDKVSAEPDYLNYAYDLYDKDNNLLSDSDMPTLSTPDQVYDFYLAPAEHNTWTFNEKDINSDTNFNSQKLDLIMDHTDYNNSLIANFKTKLSLDRTLDLDNVIVFLEMGGEFTWTYYGKLSDKANDTMTIGQYIYFGSGHLNPDGSLAELPKDTTAEQLLDYLMMISDTNPLSGIVNFVYEPKVDTGDNSNNNNSSDNSNSITLTNKNIATTTNVVNLYDANGKRITNRGLDINTTWQSDAIYKLNGELYYRVSGDEYVKVSDVYAYTDDDLANIKINNDQKGDLVDYLGGDLDRKLGAGSEWKTDRIALIKGKEYYRVSTDEFVPVDEVSKY